MGGIILFGGTFDPIHRGHLVVARAAKEWLKADKVIFIPAKNPRWKDPISSTDRLEMLQLALRDQVDFSISHYELESDRPVNYSFETVAHFTRRYPDEKLYFLIGFDQVDNLDRWHEIERISTLVKIVAAARPGYPQNHKLLKKYDVQVLECPGCEVSSTAVRALQSLDVPRPVLEYILAHELYFTRSVEAYMSPERYLHSVSTAWLAYDIAVANSLDPGPAFTAGYLHDIAREMENAKALVLMRRCYPEQLPCPPYVYHQFIGEHIAKTYFKIRDSRILEAIRYHTTGERALGKYAKILYAADKIEPRRGYDSREMIAAVKEDLTSGFKLVLRRNCEYNRGQVETNLQRRCRAYYLKGEDQ